MENDLIYLDTYLLQQDMRIRLPKAILTNLPAEKGKTKFEIYLDKAGLYRYRLIASNGESVAMAEDGYKSKSGCLGGIKSVAANAPTSEIVDESAK